MRFFIAFFISLFIYMALIWLVVTNFSDIKVMPKKRNEHIIKIDIRDIPTPKKALESEALAPNITRLKPSIPNFIKPKIKKTIKKKKMVKKKPIKKRVIKKKIVKKKPIKKRVIKKRIVKKKPIKKRVIKKRIVKKKPIKKRVIKKRIVKKKPIKKRVVEEQVVIDNSLLMQSFEVIEPVKEVRRVKPKANSNDLSSFLSTPSSSVATKSYPNRKIRNLYGSSFHSFTPTQKSFIKDNLNTIQGITQRILTQRGYPQGAGRTRQAGTNVVSFKLHPNGTISHLRLKTRIGYRALDDNTLSLIRTAYREYPYPSTTTQIIFYVTYSIY